LKILILLRRGGKGRGIAALLVVVGSWMMVERQTKRVVVKDEIGETRTKRMMGEKEMRLSNSRSGTMSLALALIPLNLGTS
jgi:hypothetical protein